MITLTFDGAAQNPANFTPDFVLPTGYQAGEVQTLAPGTFVGNDVSASSGWIDTTYSDNSYAETVWSSNGNSTQSRGPMFVNTSGDGYLLLVRGSDFRFFKVVGSTLTELDLVAQTVAAGDVLRLEYKGAGEFIYYHNGTQVGTTTDTTTTTGLSAGFVCRGGAAHIDSFTADTIPVVLPTARKGSTFTVDKPGTLGTVTTATLNAVNVFDHLTAQDATTATFAGAFTDEITTSGAYSLVLGDGTVTETIQIQVNVVGLPSNTARKDGALLASLSDLTLDAVNSTGTVVKQLTGLATNTSGVIDPVDLSDISEAAGDMLKVSLHSAASDVGVTFEQALELI